MTLGHNHEEHFGLSYPRPESKKASEWLSRIRNYLGEDHSSSLVEVAEQVKASLDLDWVHLADLTSFTWWKVHDNLFNLARLLQLLRPKTYLAILQNHGFCTHPRIPQELNSLANRLLKSARTINEPCNEEKVRDVIDLRRQLGIMASEHDWQSVAYIFQSAICREEKAYISLRALFAYYKDHSPSTIKQGPFLLVAILSRREDLSLLLLEYELFDPYALSPVGSPWFTEISHPLQLAIYRFCSVDLIRTLCEALTNSGQDTFDHRRMFIALARNVRTEESAESCWAQAIISQIRLRDGGWDGRLVKPELIDKYLGYVFRDILDDLYVNHQDFGRKPTDMQLLKAEVAKILE